MTGLKVDEEEILMGDRKCRFYSLVDVDSVALPSLIRPFTSIEVNNSSMPVDLVAAVDSVPDAQTVIYNQVIFMPGQKKEMSALEKKRNRHGSIPSPANHPPEQAGLQPAGALRGFLPGQLLFPESRLRPVPDAR